MHKQIKVDGVIIVSTPQEIALLDVKRGIKMFDKLKVPILGLVDNMSFFKSDDGKNYNIFGEGGVEKVAKDYKKEFLGKIPINIDLRVARLIRENHFLKKIQITKFQKFLER